ncbi:MAG: T9SS type A sorting domain-containing protein, partial [bacterium]
SGDGGPRDFDPEDSLTVHITDAHGLANSVGTPSNVSLSMRHDSATGPTAANQVWTSWITKPMDLSIPDNLNAGWGDYRMIVGQNSGIGFDGGGEDGDPVGASTIWAPGTTCQYYVKVIDDLNNEAVFPGSADDDPPAYFEWSVLPFLVKTNGTKGPFDGTAQAAIHILLVDDFTRNALDFENSSGFVSNGGAGGGTFNDPVYDQPEDLVERALSMLYGGSEGNGDPALYDPHWDTYDVQGAGSSVQCEPRGISELPGIGGYGSDVGVPNYDAIVWLNGTFDQYSYADTTRLELKTFLDNGGKLFGCGDDVVFHLDANGNNADSSIGFVVDYLGCDLPSSAHDATLDRTLSITGELGTSLEEICSLGVYGECPIRRSFDRMQLSTPTGGTATILAKYSGGNAADNGTAAIIKCARNAGGGVSVHAGFDISALLSDDSRACVLDAVFTGDFGLPATAFGHCCISIPVAPVVGRFGYDLARATPNPFRRATSIRFRVPSRQHVSIEVYNVLGQRVRTLVDETLDANSYAREWDGRSDDAVPVSSGIYFYKMLAGDFRKTEKTVLLK